VKTAWFLRFIRLTLFASFLPSYFLIARTEWWYVPLLTLGALALLEVLGREKIPFPLSPFPALFGEFFLIATSGWEKSPLLLFVVFVPVTYFLEEQFQPGLLLCLANTFVLSFLGGKALRAGNVFALSYLLGLGVVMWSIFVAIKMERNTIIRRLVNLEKLADRDPLTGLGNRRALQRVMVTLIEQKTPFVLAIIDLDCFKECNDRYGHQAGDEVLQRFGQHLRVLSRKTDFVFRYGGDEFIVIFPETGPGEAEAVLKRMEEKLRETFTELGMSWGMASFPKEEREKSRLLHLADERLYKAKRARKRVTQTVI